MISIHNVVNVGILITFVLTETFSIKNLKKLKESTKLDLYTKMHVLQI